MLSFVTGGKLYCDVEDKKLGSGLSRRLAVLCVYVSRK